jgi:gas vesicle protein
MRQIMNFITGMILGGLVGATVAILFAPASDEDLRYQIQERSIQIRDEVKAVADARRAELERELSALRTPYKSE